jgi:hypothetical protein
MTARRVEVASRQDMETSISRYIACGYLVMNKTEVSAVLVKKKQFNIPIAVLGFLFCVAGLALYAIIYACQSDQVIEIVVSDSQTRLLQRVPPPIPRP